MSNDKQLPEGWRMVKFGDMAKHISKRVEPSETHLNIYVGLEHLDPDSLRIKRHGVPSDVEGQKLLVKKGQIIFGKRRAYQRKLGVAEWDCICSAHAMVLEANPETVLPEFLPFFMLSDVFMNRAIAISEGSLSPTIKWKSLSNQEFSIPSIEKQQTFIEKYNLLEVVEEKIDLLLIANKKLSSVVLGELSVSSKSMPYKLSEFCKIIRGASPRPKGDPRYYGGDVPRLMTADMNRDGKYVTPKIDFLTQEGAKKSRLMKAGSVVIICSGGVDTVGLPSILKIDSCIHDGIIALDNINESICRPEFLYYILKSNQRKLNEHATHGGVFVNLTTGIINNIVLKFPTIEHQDLIISTLQKFDILDAHIRSKIEAIKILRKSIMNG